MVCAGPISFIRYLAVGKYRGGPAKASVLASAAMGSISGSAIANTVTTGSLTIPMMKKLGYKPEQAAGIEAAASTGGADHAANYGGRRFCHGRVH